MRRTALKGYREGTDDVGPDECREVAEFIIGQCRGLQRSLDMRMLFIGYTHYLQWRECQSGCDWRDLVATHVKERPISVGETRTHGQRDAQKQAELDLAAELIATTEDRVERFKIWHERTGKSEPTLYRRIADLEDVPFSGSHSQ
jgi:hypothetical protein